MFENENRDENKYLCRINSNSWLKYYLCMCTIPGPRCDIFTCSKHTYHAKEPVST